LFDLFCIQRRETKKNSKKNIKTKKIKMSTNQDDKLSKNCSDLATSALHWNFIDKILNKIDEVEDCENKIKQNTYLCEKAGFVYMFNSKSKESNQLINIEIPLISDNNYLCSMSKLFSSPVFISKPFVVEDEQQQQQQEKDENKCIPKEPTRINAIEKQDENKCIPKEPTRINVIEKQDEKKCNPKEPTTINVIEKQDEKKCNPKEQNTISVVEEIVITSSSSGAASAPENDKLEKETQSDDSKITIREEIQISNQSEDSTN
jgi:hypothetical protein